jgi:hypothetical protein
MNDFRLCLAALAALAASLPRTAAAQPPDAAGAQEPAAFQISLWDSVQIVDRLRPIHGLRLSLPYGRNRELQGADIGIVGRIDGNLEGAQFSVAGAMLSGAIDCAAEKDVILSAAGRVTGVSRVEDHLRIEGR